MGSNEDKTNQEIIRDLKQQRDQLDFAVIYYKRQKEEYQKTQIILNQTQRVKEEKYLNDIIQLQAKNKDLENVVCKMGRSNETLRLLTNGQKAFRDNLRKSGLGYNSPYVLSQAYAKISKLYRAYELCNKNEQLHVFDYEETLEDAEKMTSLIKENEHLKLTYKNLFDSIKKLRVQTKTLNVTQNEAENLKSQLFEFAETKFSNILEKIEFFKKSPGEKQHLFEHKTSVFQIKIDEFENVLTQQTKDFNAVKLELSNRIAKLEVYFEKLEKTKVILERQLARKVDDSKAEKDQFLKEINHLRTQLENLKGKSVKTKFDKHSILGKPPADKLLINSQISKSWFTPKVDMQKSLSKPVTAQSLPKNEKDQLLKQIAYLESKLAS
ncbi:hypothetical protein Tco_1076164, partial [Tanacetum coccineum]